MWAGESTEGAEGAEAVIHPAALRYFRHTYCRVCPTVLFNAWLSKEPALIGEMWFGLVLFCFQLGYLKKDWKARSLLSELRWWLMRCFTSSCTTYSICPHLFAPICVDLLELWVILSLVRSVTHLSRRGSIAPGCDSHLSLPRNSTEQSIAGSIGPCSPCQHFNVFFSWS